MDLSVVFAGIGAATGIGGFIVGILAKLDSKSASDISQRSHKAALNSNALAAEANRIAVDARQLAEEANTISLRAEKRDTEINHVSWNYNWVNPSTCQVINTGQDKALRVTVTVAVDGEHVSHSPIDIEPGAGVCVALPKLLGKLRRHEAEFLAEQDAANSAGTGPFGIDLNIPVPYMPLKFDVIVTIQWLTPLGKQREKVFKDPGSTFIL